MKKNTILSVLMVLIIIAGTIFLSDGLTWLVTSLMALAIGGVIHYNGRRVTRLTRWAKANPAKSQVFITVLQVALMASGIAAGYDLKEAGYEFSDITAYVFGAIIIIGFLSVPFLPKRNAMTIPRVVNNRRLAYIGIILSSFVMMAVLGNRLESEYPDSPLTYAVRTIDNAIFQDNSLSADPGDEAVQAEAGYDKNESQALAGGSSDIAVFASYIYDKETTASSTLSKKELREKIKTEKRVKKFEKKKQKMMNLLKKRLVLAAAIGVGGVLLIVLLVITSCAGICIMLLGATAGSVILGALITGGSVFGIVKIAQGKKRKIKTEP